MALAIACLYAGIGAAWILYSDAFVLSISHEVAWIQNAQRFKGLFYILLTAMGLGALVHLGYLRLLRSAAASRSNELQVQDMFLRHPQPMWLYDRDSLAFLQVNDAALAGYGYTEQEFLGMTLRDIRPLEDVPMVEALNSRPPTPALYVGTVRHRRKSGEVFFAQINAHSVPYLGRLATMVMAIDVTPQVQATKALERQEARFRQLFQSLGEVLWLASADGRKIIHVSQAFEKIYGRPPSDLERDPSLWLQAVHPDDRHHALASNNQLWAIGHSSCEYRITRPDGGVRWISDRKNIIIDAESDLRLIGGIAEDITAQKERDAAIATTQQDLERMVAERTTELAHANVELEAFTRTAAHDLKSPLNGIVGMSYLLKSRFGPALGEEGLDMVNQIESSSLRMAMLVNDLLALSRVTQVELKLQELDLVPMAHEVIEDLRRQSPQRTLTFLAPPALPVLCDVGLTRSLMTNLLSNAWKFTANKPDARIALSATLSPSATLVALEDNGAGFESGEAKDLFKPFQRFHPTSEFSGTGVGLVTCQRIVRRHGGDIQISSAPGVGTTVTFSMPRPAQALEVPVHGQSV